LARRGPPQKVKNKKQTKVAGAFSVPKCGWGKGDKRPPKRGRKIAGKGKQKRHDLVQHVHAKEKKIQKKAVGGWRTLRPNLDAHREVGGQIVKKRTKRALGSRKMGTKVNRRD